MSIKWKRYCLGNREEAFKFFCQRMKMRNALACYLFILDWMIRYRAIRLNNLQCPCPQSITDDMVQYRGSNDCISESMIPCVERHDPSKGHQDLLGNYEEKDVAKAAAFLKTRLAGSFQAEAYITEPLVGKKQQKCEGRSKCVRSCRIFWEYSWHFVEQNIVVWTWCLPLMRQGSVRVGGQRRSLQCTGVRLCR